MAKRDLTDQTSIIIDPQDYYNADIEVEIICTMLAGAYGMGKLYATCMNCIDLFDDADRQPIVKALMQIYDQNGRTYFETHNKKAFLRVFESVLSGFVKNETDREYIRDQLFVYIEKMTDDEFHYTSPDDIDLLCAALPDYFQLINNQNFVSEIKTINQTEYTPVDYNKAVEKAFDNRKQLIFDGNTVIDTNNEQLRDMWRSQQRRKSLFKLPTSMGAFATAINPLFYSTAFVSVLAPEKTGKSWLLQELALQACRRGCNVLFIAAGDMTSMEMNERMAIRKAGRNSEANYCGELYVPVLDCKRNQNGTCTMNKRTGKLPLVKTRNEKQPNRALQKKHDREVSKKQTPEMLLAENQGYLPCCECFRSDNRAWIPTHWWIKQNPTVSLLEMTDDEYTAFMNEKNGHWSKGALYIYDSPANTVTISKIKTLIRQHRRTCKKIDMVVIDYMDILAPERHYSRDYRQMQNELWLDARSLAVSEDVFLLVATQANRMSDDVEYLTKANISEDIRKCAHVTAMIGMMRKPQDKRMGLAKMNIIAARGASYSEDDVYTVLQCLEQGNPFITSYLPKYFSNND